MSTQALPSPAIDADAAVAKLFLTPAGRIAARRGPLRDVTATTHMLTYALSRERLKALIAADATVRAWMLEEVARRYPDGR